MDEKNKEELELPVTPESYEIDHGVNREKITLTELGTTNLSGKRYMMDIKIECMFPAQSYSFCNAGARTESTTAVQAEKTYKIASGDTLSGISRKFYGDSSLYGKLASYNGIKNANLIRAGGTIKIPDKGKL